MSDTTKKALRMAELAIDGLEVIQGLTKLGGEKAEHALQAIGKIVDTLQSGFDGKATATDVGEMLDLLRAELLNNDAAADAALKARFGR